ncbi:hypothetical protein CDE51_11915, partial [Pasteurella multocida]
MFNKALAWQ